ncbi:hypothetical protein NW752_007431 [Fusarium irregulare]|uniref:CHAT domain-containing protein n=1 Tax=Fusarium irregulare TaxID=2494466 RepID=A0A9W8U7C5_9HYPO|nr:hypothetical protein NW766_007663 [Fusarium irregulare]KAJ4014660.1 hypothetical protein NW752_007431 [Fusarium irregulare]
MNSDTYLVNVCAETSGRNAAKREDEDDPRHSLFTEEGAVSLGYLMDENDECCELAVQGDLVSLSIAIDKIQNLRRQLSNHSLHSTSISNNAVHLFAQRYCCTNDTEDLDLCIAAGSDMVSPSGATETDPQEDFERSLRVGMLALGIAHHWRFELQGEGADLQLAIFHKFKGLSMDGWEEQRSNATEWFNLGNWCHELFTKTHDIKDVNMSAKCYEKALQANYRDPLEANFSLARTLRLNFDMTSDMKILERCIEVIQEVIRISPPEGQYRPQHYTNLSYCFQKRFDVSEESSDLDLAITSLQEAYRLVLSRSGSQQYCSIAPIEHITQDPKAARTEAKRREFISKIPKDAKESQLLSIRLADLLFKRWQRAQNEDDLDCSASLFANAEDFFHKDSELHHDQAKMARHVREVRWNHLGDVRDLDDIVKSLQSSIVSLPQGHSERLMNLMNLALYQLIQYYNTGKPDNLESLSKIAQYGLDNDVDGPWRVRWLEISACVQEARSLMSGDLSLMEDAIQLVNQAIDQLERDESSDSWLLYHMGDVVARLCQQSGRSPELDNGIDAITRSLRYIDNSSEEAANRLTNLAWWHMVRGDRTGDMRDLTCAIQLAEKATSISQNARCLTVLSYCHGAIFKRSRNLEDFDNSIQQLEQWPEDKQGPGAAELRQRFANLLIDRGDLTGSTQDIDASIRTSRRIIEVSSEGGQHWIGGHLSLGLALRSRWEIDPKSLDDINEAIAVFTKIKNQALVIDLRGQTLYALGCCYNIRLLHKEPWDPVEAQRSMICFLECFRQQSTSLQLRIKSAIHTATLADSLSLTKEALKTLKEALDLLPALNLRSLSIQDQQEVIKGAAGLATMATALEFKCDPQSDQALHILERGRGVITHLLTEERTMISMLDPKLASEFTEAKRRISAVHPGVPMPLGTDLTTDYQVQVSGLDAGARRTAENHLLEVIKKIENDPKTKAFFEPPSIEEIFAALGDDNIAIVNVSDIRCDLVVMSRRTGIRQTPLPRLLFQDVDIQAKKLKDSRPRIDPSLLKWLWYVIGEAVVSELELKIPAKGQPLPRLFWILTGPLAQLPVHAAGYYHEGGKKTILDRAMSSYCSSLRSFISSRVAKLSSSPQGGGLDKALLVAMEQTPNHSPLANATKEIDAVEKMCGHLHLQPHRLPTPTRATVLEGLDAQMFHFAGHGRSETSDPSQSGLLLNDGPLTVAEIREHKSDGKLPFLAFLSACLTAANDSEKLADESIHLLTACQVAGFRHLIGSLWPLYDDACVDIAQSFYKNLLSTGSEDRSVCEALHLTCVQSRDLWVARSLMAATNLADKSPSNGSDATDMNVLPGTAGSGNDHRDARLAKKRPQGVNLVKAEWVPYVHYGP